ncbi:unnamed protein product [Parnassius apollo]|uniref:(apollo) hypothetical protein n=1 Tax=Parnassius apollo TaxID=110799 RepID=A0A8S3XJL2_PARAO|nr:unnamed protein product [Parnassius apollo]
MAAKIAVLLCLFGLTRAGTLYSGSALGYSSGLGYATNLGHRSGLEYATGLGQGADLGYEASLGHGEGLGYRTGYSNDLGYASQDYGGYGASAAHTRPDISTVSQYNIHTAPIAKTYAAPVAAYSSTYGAHRAYGRAISYRGQGHGGYGFGGFGTAYGGYGRKYTL